MDTSRQLRRQRFVVVNNDNIIVGSLVTYDAALQLETAKKYGHEKLIEHDTADNRWTYDPETGELVPPDAD